MAIRSPLSFIFWSSERVKPVRDVAVRRCACRGTGIHGVTLVLSATAITAALTAVLPALFLPGKPTTAPPQHPATAPDIQP